MIRYTASIITGLAMGGLIAAIFNPAWWVPLFAFSVGAMLGAVIWGVIFLTKVATHKFWGYS